MTGELEVLGDVSTRLGTLGIAHMLTGSLAMARYGTPRMTRDIDLVVELPRTRVRALVEAFAPDYYVDGGAVSEAVRIRSMFNMIHNESVTKVDCIVRGDSPYRRHEFERRRHVAIGDVRTSIVTREDLILSKLAWAKISRSEMQLRDVRNLMQAGYDERYVDRWADELGVASLLEELRRG
jgi:hypothetical protein